jgi:hypothetical protein
MGALAGRIAGASSPPRTPRTPSAGAQVLPGVLPMITGLGDQSSKMSWDFVDSLPMVGTPATSTITIGPSTVTPVKPKPLPNSSSASPKILGMPRGTAILVAGLVAAGVLTLVFSHSGWGGGERSKRNPKGGGGVYSRDPEVQRAIDFRRSFHWGIPARSISRRRVSPMPRVLVELGKIHSVTYRTKKQGESAELYEHTFEDSQPTLGMDIRNKRLHVVGGSYTVTADGITG